MISLLRSNTAQLWRLSDLKLLKTFRLDPGTQLYAHLSPEEVRVGPDGAAYIQTLACGIERVSGMETDEPKAQLVHTFPGSWCGVPTMAGKFLVEGIPDIHGFIVLDMSDGLHPREVSRLVISPDYAAHWTGLDRATGRIVVTSERPGDRTYLLSSTRQPVARHRHRLSRCRWNSRLQLREPRLAARLRPAPAGRTAHSFHASRMA